jgi:hypothetical protein
MELRSRKNNAHGAGERAPSTGVGAEGQAGPTPTSLSKGDLPGADRQAPGRVYTSGEEDDKRNGRRMSVESGMSAASSSGGNDPGFSGDELPLRRMGDRSDEDRASDAFSLATAPGKRRSSVTTEPVASMAEYRKETIGQTTADLGAEVMREMEEVERIATSSNNLKGIYVRRLRPVRCGRSALSFSSVLSSPLGTLLTRTEKVK